MQFLIVALTLTVVVGGFLLFLWIKVRNAFREAKNIERGLKMTPLLIHLPPSSSDIEGGSRDQRDVTDETISKAETLYDIISSVAQKENFKGRLYGTPHISFEIVGAKGRVYFYTAVPVPLIDVVKQAIVGSYPTARLEEVEEHNIFSPVGKISGTAGGEMVLKESYVSPIATFQETRKDSITTILNALGELGLEDGAGIQILIRPARKGWIEASKAKAKEIREGKKRKGWKNAFWWVKQLGTALWAAPEAGGDSGKESGPKQLSSLEQAHVDAIEEKTRHSAFETLIRVVASSNQPQKAKSILRNIVASFSMFDAPGKNGFKFVEAKDVENFVTGYIMRFFPQQNNKNILNSIELATIFHFPDERLTPTSQVDRQSFKQVDGPRNMPEEGIALGYNVFRGVKREVRLSQNDKKRHVYIVGQTGTGKSVLMENMAAQDMLAGGGMCFVDPHGDSVERLLGMVPKERVDDVIYFCPADTDYPMGLNMFEFHTQDEKDFLIQEAIQMLYSLYDPNRQGIIGPRFEQIFRNAALLLMADPAGGTFVDIPKLLVDTDFVRNKLKHVTDQTVLDFWTKEWPNAQRSNESGDINSWVIAKFGAFLSNEMMRNIIGQTQSAFNMRKIMDEGKIFLVNLSKGRTGELNSRLLGMIFVMKFQNAAMSRADIREDERRPFTLYVDEFQNFSTNSFASILSEVRKYGLSLVVGNQFTSQLNEEVRDAVRGNVGSIMSFRIGVADAEFIAKQLSPTFDVEDLVEIPNFNVATRIMIENVPSQPFSMATLPPLGHFNPELAKALKRLSMAKFGRPRKVVNDEIFARLKSIPSMPSPSLGSPGGAMSSAPRAGASVPPAGGSSFLDEWLAKRRQEVAQKSKPSDGASPSASPFQPAQPKPTGQVGGITESSSDKPQLESIDSTQADPSKPADSTETPKTPDQTSRQVKDQDEGVLGHDDEIAIR